LEPVLSLGEIPLVHALVEPGAAEPDRRYPLELVRCAQCSLVQITETVPPEKLFRQYTYFSSYSQTFLDHARRFSEDAIHRLGLGGDSLVIEAASNDGYLLQYFADAGVPSVGIDPAENVAAVARARGVETIAEFLDEALAAWIVSERGPADLVIANNVLAHVADLHGFVAALRTLAGETGTIAIEVPYLCNLVDRLAFDTVYHEHLCYFSLTSLTAVAERHGLTIRSVERLAVHGGSLRVHLSASGAPDGAVAGLLEQERAWGVGERDRFDRFATAVDSLRQTLHAFVVELVDSGGRVAAYGAAAKGTVLANTCGLDRELVAFVVDRNPHKQGKLLPGVRIPVEPRELLIERAPDYCLLFAWNLAAEIASQEASYRDCGGRFVVPIPVPHVLDG
jgi:hypothetical protein